MLRFVSSALALLGLVIVLTAGCDSSSSAPQVPTKPAATIPQKNPTNLGTAQ